MARKKDVGLRERILQASLEMTADPDFVNFTTAKIAKAAGVSAVVFDRGGFRYHGRVAGVADGAREAGLEF